MGFGDQAPRPLSIRLVGKAGLKVADIGIDRVAEEQQLDDGKADDHAGRQAVAAELQDLLVSDGENPVEEGHRASSVG